MLSEWRPRLPELFDLPCEVRSYRDFDELVAAIRELCHLDHAARRRMGNAAAARAHREHTYVHRFERIVSVLGRG